MRFAQEFSRAARDLENAKKRLQDQKTAIDLLSAADGGLLDIHTIAHAVVTQTAKLNFHGSYVQSDVKEVNGTALTGDGSATPWGPA